MDYPHDQTIVNLFEQQVEKTPLNIAVVFEEQQLTYQELNRKANQLAHYLQKTIGIQPEVLVGLCVERSVEMVIGLLGILKAGSAYVPLDPSYPKERLTFLLKEANVPVLLTLEKIVHELPSHQAQVIYLDTDWDSISQQPDNNPVSGVMPDNLAYVIYTSGSTGKPKGVLVTHDNVTRLFAATHSWFQFNEQEVWALFHSYAFDFSVWELWGALLYGGRLVVVPYWISRSPEAFYELLDTQGITVLNQTPSAFIQLIQAEERLGVSDKLRLRWIIFGGEALEFQCLKPWFERHGDNNPQLVNMYGITETTVHVTYHPLTWADLNRTGTVIGRPIPDIQAYLLDRYLQPVPLGVPGELHIGGAGLARGYLNRPKLTFDQFIPNPFSEKPKARLYKTGDLARYLPDGNIEYLGRIDNQVKIRGFRIELGEIDAILMQHPAVQEAIVTVQKDSHNNKYLVAYVVVKNKDSKISTNDLRYFLKEQLPDYMVPATFVTLDTLPLTAHGKIDYRALPLPDSARPELSADFVAPRTLEEELLADIWAVVLNLKQVGIYDNFFELGGDSIRSIQVLAQAKEVGLVFSLQQFFQHQTIYELARSISPANGGDLSIPTTTAWSLVSKKERQKLSDEVEDAYPLAELQAGLLFHSEHSPETAIYHDVFSYHLKAPLDSQALYQAIQQVVTLHPMLRTSFALTGFKEPLQLVHKTVESPLPIEDLRSLSNAEQEAALTAWIDAEKHRPFDWKNPPLLRFHLHPRTKDTFNLTLSFHHAIFDGWSVASLMTELFQQYLSQLGQDIALQLPPAISFRDFVALERSAVESEECRQYWLETLNDFTMLKLPRWQISYWTVQPGQTGSLEVPIAASVSDGLKQLAITAGVPIKSVLLAAHLKVLSGLSNQTDVLTGASSNGRSEETDGERVLGLFVSVLPFRLHLSGGSWIELVQKTFQVEQAFMPYRRFPLAEIQRMLGGQALFETAFNFIHFHVYQQILGFQEVESLGGQTFERTNFTLLTTFGLDLITQQVNLTLSYDAGELAEEQVQAISGYYTEALTAMATNPSDRYEHHSLLSDSERQQLLIEWNNTTTDYPKNQCIHHLFEAQVENTPNAIAVVFEDQQLTYRELNTKANLVAHYLQTLGVKPEVLVGICVERSVEMVIGVLSILKAGGAYMPLDSNFPRERLAFMLEDSQIPVLLTQEKLMAKLPVIAKNPASKILTHFVCLDTDWNLFSQFSSVNPVNDVKSENLAYVIYTSGSTGKPKGVMIEHHNVLAMLHGFEHIAPCSQPLKGSSVCPFSFDVSVWEWFSNLCFGGTLYVIPHEILIHSESLVSYLVDHHITCTYIPPALLSQVATWFEKMADLIELNRILVGVEPIEQNILQRFRHLSEQLHIVNGYGPTEATICATFFSFVNAVDLNHRTPIGTSQLGYKIYLVDSHLQPVPIGVSGEILIGGAGLARGYLNRPELTAEKFFPNPFNEAHESRLYKTGDLGRYLSDGNIEFVGRLDSQIKVRGFRIELGEIEAVLVQHPAVREAVITCTDQQPNDKRLIAYLVPSQNDEVEMIDNSAIRGQNANYISQWEHLFDESYSQPSTGQEQRFNITGWNSSYTGLPIAAAEMREWVNSTVNLIGSQQPNRILEIGCGTGLLLSRIAPYCGQYWATDFSSAALQQIEQLKQTTDSLEHVVLFNRKADNWSEIDRESFDTVILNSVVQYFPSITYLLDVLQKAVNVVKSSGYLFIGDVRSFPLLKAYHTSVQLFQAAASLTQLELQHHLQQSLGQEEELAIDPTFFLALKQHNPRITIVNIQPKRGRYHNELTRFRYDVILQVGGHVSSTETEIAWQDWQKYPFTLSSLRQQLV